MEERSYRPRLIDRELKEYLSTFGAVCIEGPRGCGKTQTASRYCKSHILLSDPAGEYNNRQLADLSPNLVLDGETPRLLDEWHEVPALWDAVRYRVDQTPEKGQFLLTGSSTPSHKGILHSGAGRIASLRMRPMSLYESGDSSGDVSLEALCHGELNPVMGEAEDLRQIIGLIRRGGWPASLGLADDQAAGLSGDYLNAALEDACRLDGVKRDARKLRLLLRVLARNESATISMRALGKDEGLDPVTVATYLDICQRLFLTDNQPPFPSRIHTPMRVKQAEKRHLADPSLACALLKATSETLLGDLATLKSLFEALCVRDLRIYAETFGATLSHYQDYSGHKIDAVIELRDGTWCAFQILLGANQIDSAAASLLRIQAQFAAVPNGKPPAVLGVICGLSSAAYQRPDGVFVVPITALKP